MHSFIDDLMDAEPANKRETARARLRVAVAEGLLLRMEALDLTKAQLAATLGVSRSAVSQALTGTRNMSLNLLADLAAALGLDVRVVFEARGAAIAATFPSSIAVHTGSRPHQTVGTGLIQYAHPVPNQAPGYFSITGTGAADWVVPGAAKPIQTSAH